MAARFYLMPITLIGNRRYPKYYATHLAGLTLGSMDYGPEDVCLVAVQDIPPATHTALTAEADCTALPEDIDAAIGAQLTAVKNAMETLNIPSGWVQATDTFRHVARIVGGLFQFMQRYNGLGGGKLFAGANLDNTYSSLPLAVRNRLRDTADDLGYDRSSVTGSTTLRELLKLVADQWSDRPLDFRPITTL